MKWLGLVFSGTGNTLWVAKTLKSELEKININLELNGIEEQDVTPEWVSKNIHKYDAFGVFYPIHSSNMPNIMKTFLKKVSARTTISQNHSIKGFCITSVAIFSGDGALMVEKYYKKMGISLCWAENIQMPSNLNLRLPYLRIPKKNLDSYLLRYQQKAHTKIKALINNIKTDKILLKGDNLISHIGGSFQRLSERSFEKFDIKINNDKCILCGLCIELCPSDNFEFKIKDNERKLVSNNQCTLCTRCLHHCPAYALRIMNKKASRPFNQYKPYSLSTINLKKYPLSKSK